MRRAERAGGWCEPVRASLRTRPGAAGLNVLTLGSDGLPRYGSLSGQVFIVLVRCAEQASGNQRWYRGMQVSSFG